MNPLAFAILLWLFTGLQVGLGELLAVGEGAIKPSFLLPLLVYVALFAPTLAVQWAALAVGLAIDLTWSVPLSNGGAATIVGPASLGCLAAAHLVLSLRASMMPRNPLTLGFLTLLAGVVTHVVIVALLTLRDAYDPLAWRATAELITRLGSALSSGLVAILLALILLPLSPLMGFPASTTPRRSPARRS